MQLLRGSRRIGRSFGAAEREEDDGVPKHEHGEPRIGGKVGSEPEPRADLDRTIRIRHDLGSIPQPSLILLSRLQPQQAIAALPARRRGRLGKRVHGHLPLGAVGEQDHLVD